MKQMLNHQNGLPTKRNYQNYDVEGGKQKILIKSMMHTSKLFKMGSYVYDIPNWNPISPTLEK